MYRPEIGPDLSVKNMMQPVDCSGPLFSVLIPAYNREAYIGEAIASILAQKGADFELIVIDDGSIDRTVEVVKGFKDSRLRLFCESHAGGAAARNKGISEAIGKFVITVGSDDFMAPEALAQLAKSIRACPEADIFYGDLGIFSESEPGKIHYTQYPDYFNSPLLPKLIQGNCLPDGGTAVRRKLYVEHGLYDVSFVRCHDYQMWTRLVATAKVKKVEFVTYYWRLHGTNLSNERSKAFEAKVVVDMFARYPVSRLFPDLMDDPKGEAEGRWRLSKTLEAFQEYSLAYQAACKAVALGGGHKNRMEQLKRKVSLDHVPYFSVVVTTYNRPELLECALDSLEKQGFKDFEVILINDNGRPVEQILECFEFPILYVRQGYNTGPAAARNTALKLARGRYVTFLDDDDCYLPGHLLELALASEKAPGEVFILMLYSLRRKLKGRFESNWLGRSVISMLNTQKSVCLLIIIFL